MIRTGERQAGPYILVVEDNDGLRESMVEALLDSGYEAAGCAHGQEALTFMALAGPPELIVTDLEMPVMDGRALIAELGRDPLLATVPVVVVTGSQAPDLQGTVAAVVHKPYTWPTLERVFKWVLKKSSMRVPEAK
jgi:CheY-like chemotaxis protein